VVRRSRDHAWWDDLWLNESFAEWAAHHANVHATRFPEAWTTFANLRKAWAYRQDQLPSTHPIAADMVDLDAVRVNFDGITYAKGASALRQLVAWVGEEEFLAGLHEYFVKHAWGNTELRDLSDGTWKPPAVAIYPSGRLSGCRPAE
jgi:aminopeptidase N